MSIHLLLATATVDRHKNQQNKKESSNYTPNDNEKRVIILAAFIFAFLQNLPDCKLSIAHACAYVSLIRAQVQYKDVFLVSLSGHNFWVGLGNIEEDQFVRN